MKKVIQEKSNTENLDIVQEFSKILDISLEDAKEIQSKMDFEEYYDLIGYIEEKNIPKIKDIYNKYTSKKLSISDEIIDILDSYQDIAVKSKKIKDSLYPLEKEQFKSIMLEIQKEDNKNIDLIYNLIFKEFPKNLNIEEKINKIHEKIKKEENNNENINMLKKIETLNDVLKEDLLNKGYNYYTHIEYPKCKDKIIDWLENNKIEFLVDQKGLFHIKCLNRDLLYKIENIIVSILSKYNYGIDFIRDNKFVKKEKLDEIKNKNISEKRSTDIVFFKGETVLYKEKEVLIKIPNGPANTVGIIEEGNLTMVNFSEIQKLNERVLGFSKMPSINRMLELAGIENHDIKEEEEKTIDNSDNNILDQEKQTKISDTKKEIVNAVEKPQIKEPIDLDNTENKKEISLDVPPSDITPIDQSEEFIKAIAMLDQVHQLVTEMKLSEYKIFIQRLEDFTQRIQRIGREYLR